MKSHMNDKNAVSAPETFKPLNQTLGALEALHKI